MIGEAVSHFRIIEKIGEGGMGEVYLAEDTSLDRKAALKFISQEFSADDIARARLLREAKNAAALDHPYICNIFEIGEHEGRSFIAMEYVEGETLKSRLAEAPLPLDEALRIGSEITEALEKAHLEGIVHRDLKPANVMLTSAGHVKILDFGVAKRLYQGPDPRASASAPTTLTPEGALIGTVSYMSPEQLRSDDLDGRSDIFSFGIICYEMLTGVHPFARSGMVETASAILQEEPPPLARYRGGVSELHEHAIRKMLAKKIFRRYQSAHEVHTDLEDIRASSQATSSVSGVGMPGRSRWTKVLPWALVPLAVVLAIVGTTWVMSQRESPLDSSQQSTVDSGFDLMTGGELRLPVDQRMAHWLRHGVAVSPDGQLLTVVSGDISTQDRMRPASTQIYAQSLNRWVNQAQFEPIPGTSNAYQPVFSPDGRSLAFVQWDAERDRYLLRKTRWDSGEITTLCETDLPFGASWGQGQIVFAEKTGGLLRVSSAGGQPERLTSLDETARELSHRLPHFLPDGDSLLYTAVLHDLNPDWRRSRIYLLSLTSGESTLLIEGGSDARYLPGGHVVFARAGSLLIVPIDLERQEVTGQAVPVLEGVNHSIFSGGEWFEVGAAQFDVSEDGLLVYAPGTTYPEMKSEVAWVDRDGTETLVAVEPRRWTRARVDPNGRRLLLAHWYSPGGLWLYDLDRQLLTKQTYWGPTSVALWGPDEDFFTTHADRNGFFVKRVDSGPGSLERRPPGSEIGLTGLATSWSPDGKWLAFASAGDIWVVSSEGRSEPVLMTQFVEEFPEFSPDGRWLAYTSDESGRAEVYVRPFQREGSVVQISTQGGRAPAWSHDGAEIVYRQGGSFMSVTVSVNESGLQPSPPQELFAGPYWDSWPMRSYDIAPDGRFLVLKEAETANRGAFAAFFPDRVRLVPDWLQRVEEEIDRGR